MSRRWRAFWVKISLAVLVIIAVTALRSPVIRLYHANRAEANLSEGRPAAAAVHLEQLFVQTPGDDALCLRLADAYAEAGNMGRAENTLIRGIAARAGELSLYRRLSALYIAQDKLADAVAFLDELPDPLVKERLDASRPAPPSLTPPPGHYTEQVSLSVGAPSGTDCYVSTDGGTPSVALGAFGAPLSLPVGLTRVKAVAVRDGLPSVWLSAEYTLEDAARPVAFADPTLERALRELAGIPEGPVMSSDLWNIGRLSLPDAAYYISLSDLAHLRGLTTLTLAGGDEHMDLQPLTGLTHLKSLTLRHFALEAADMESLTGLTELETLDLRDNRLASLTPLSGLRSLTELDLRNNRLANITALRDLTGLTKLRLSQNTLDIISPLASLINLEELDLAENNLEDLRGLDELVRLRALDLSHNKVSDLTALSALTALTDLRCAGLPVASLAPLSGCTALEALVCTGGTISTAEPLSAHAALRELTLDDNLLETLDGLSGCVSLQVFRADRNRLTTLAPLAGLPLLRDVHAEGNLIASLAGLRDCPALKNVYIKGNPLSEEDVTFAGTEVAVHR
jgi:Leucine-rich repeat (LRR) protein